MNDSVPAFIDAGDNFSVLLIRIVEIAPDKFLGETNCLDKFKKRFYRNAKLCLPGVSCSLVICFEITEIFGGEQSSFVSGRFADLAAENSAAIIKYLYLRARPPLGNFESKMEDLRKKFSLPREYGVALKVQVADAQDFRSLLEVRRIAYHADGRHLQFSSWDQMCDECDKKSTIFVAKICEEIVGTIRVFEPGDNEKFSFEDVIDLPAEYSVRRSNYCELAKLAVLPLFRRSDVQKRLMQYAAATAIFRRKSALVTATTKHAPNYLATGAIKISKNFAHPVNSNEFYALYFYNFIDFESGSSVSRDVWDDFVSPAVELAEKWRFDEK